MIVVDPDAMSVPFGIDFAGFDKSPDLLAPAMIPVQAGKKMASCTKKEEPSE